MTSLLILGAGTIGNMVAAQATLKKEFDQIYLADLNPRYEFISTLVDLKKVQVCRLDITQLEQVIPFFAERRVTHVIDTACIPNTPGLKQIRNYVDVNTHGLANLLEASRLMGIKKYVYCSSNAVYDFSRQRPDNPVKEDWPGLRIDATVYDHTKFLGERLVSEYRKVFGLNGASFRLTVIYGPCPALNMGSKTWLHKIVQAAAIEKKFHCDEIPRKRLCWMYSRDAGNALVHASLFKNEFPSAVYNVSSGILNGFEEIIEILSGIIPGLDVSIGKIQDVGWKFPLDISKLREELGFVPTFTLKEGLREYVEWIWKNPKFAS